MYCPMCATQNGEETKFCRGCGANVSLVPQALTGRLPDAPHTGPRKDRGRKDPPDLGEGISRAFAGLGFILASLGVMKFAPAGRIWWFWLLIPAFALIGKGIAEIVSFYYGQGAAYAPLGHAPPPARNTGELPTPPPALMTPPPSVTEGTTRHMDPSESFKEKKY